MSEEKKHFYILGISLFVCLFICFDVYIGPVKTRQEIITDRYSIVAYAGSAGHSNFSGSYYRKYYIVTDKSQYLVTYDLSQKTDSDNSIFVSRSIFTNALREINYSFHNTQYKYNLNVLCFGDMIVFVIAAIVSICLCMIFYNYFPFASGRRQLVICMGIASGALFLLYLILNVFYFQIFF